MINRDFYLKPYWIRKRYNRFKIFFITWAIIGTLIGLSMLIAWLMLGCAVIEHRTGEGFSQNGFIKAGIWPQHNESILNHYGDVSEGLFEIKENLSYNRWNLILNPRFLTGGSWPPSLRPTSQVLFFQHHPQWVYGDLFYTIEYRLNYKKKFANWFIGYEKERAYEFWREKDPGQTGHLCNCTYSNLWYLKFTW